MVMAAAAAAASASEDHELLLNRFLPYSTSSSASQLFLDQSGTPSLTAPTNGMSNTGGGGGLVSSNSLRDTHSTHSSSSHSSSHPSSHTHPGVVASRSSAEAAVAAIYGGIPDVISLDWPEAGGDALGPAWMQRHAGPGADRRVNVSFFFFFLLQRLDRPQVIELCQPFWSHNVEKSTKYLSGWHHLKGE